MSQSDLPQGQRFSHVYIERGEPTQDSPSLDVLDAKLVGPARQEFIELHLGGPDNLVLTPLSAGRPRDSGLRVGAPSRTCSASLRTSRKREAEEDWGKERWR